jgi:hypothetical protein
LCAANRIVEVNDMWRLRSVELEYENQRARRRKESFRGMSAAREMTADRRDLNGESSQKDASGYDDRGLNDEDLEHFLQSRYTLCEAFQCVICVSALCVVLRISSLDLSFVTFASLAA